MNTKAVDWLDRTHARATARKCNCGEPNLARWYRLNECPRHYNGIKRPPTGIGDARG